MGHKGFSVVDMIPLLNQLPPHVATAMIVIVFLMVVAILGTRGLRKEPKRYFVPEARLTFRTAGEMLVEQLVKIVKDNMGPRGPEFMMIIGALALFIFSSNVLGMIPGFQSPTETLNTTGACAITVFCLTHYYGFREHGIQYLKQFTGPIIWLAPLMIPVELVGHFVRPVSLSIRLFGNIFGDHTVVAIFFSLVPLLLPLPMMILGLLVAIIQTFVFILLSMTYFSLAIEGHEHE
ncbi:MAG: ATP synthase F0 subunit A [Deltaproteobacteria bacterium RBG_13_52_11]|nr:MAG: ATP synthase F0 subunit A [Deltaproteobacteria bacterium RBG_13_52_11]